MDSLNQTTSNSLLNTGFALWLSGLSWAFALAHLQSALSILLTLASLVWVIIQIRGRLRQDARLHVPGPEGQAPRCPHCDSD